MIEKGERIINVFMKNKYFIKYLHLLILYNEIKAIVN